MTHPKGKVVYDHHHLKDKEKAALIHLLALFSAIATAAVLIAL